MSYVLSDGILKIVPLSNLEWASAGSSAGASPAKRTLDARRVDKLRQGWLRQNEATSPARRSEHDESAL